MLATASVADTLGAAEQTKTATTPSPVQLVIDDAGLQATRFGETK